MFSISLPSYFTSSIQIFVKRSIKNIQTGPIILLNVYSDSSKRSWMIQAEEITIIKIQWAYKCYLSKFPRDLKFNAFTYKAQLQVDFRFDSYRSK